MGETHFPLITGWLLAAALVFTLHFGFIQLKHSKLAIDLVCGRYDNPEVSHEGEVSHFGALATAYRARSGWATSPVGVLRWPSAGRARPSG